NHVDERARSEVMLIDGVPKPAAAQVLIKNEAKRHDLVCLGNRKKRVLHRRRCGWWIASGFQFGLPLLHQLSNPLNTRAGRNRSLPVNFRSDALGIGGYIGSVIPTKVDCRLD